MHIEIITVQHGDHRYNTVGDWYLLPDGTWQIQVSQMDDWRHWILIALHELVEMALCTHRGISAGMVDRFDMSFTGDGEPGDAALAPYAAQHCAADGVERLMATLLDVKWSDYDDAVRELAVEQE